MRILADECCDAGLEHEGVIYIRFPGDARRAMIARTQAFIAERGDLLLGCFSVLTPASARIRPRPRGD